MKVQELFSLKGKVAVITGGYGHLGTAMAQALQEAGAVVYIGARSKDKFETKFKDEENIKFVELDVSSSECFQTAFRFIKETEGHIDILVNNATYLHGQYPEQITDDDLKISFDGILGTVYRGMREVLPFMKEQHWGRIINISSMYGIVVPNFEVYQGSHAWQFNPPTYGACKAGVIQLTKFFAEYCAQWGINVNAISPGPFPNPKVQEDTEFIESLSKRNFLGRIGQPEELKGVAVLLASQASSFMTGQTIQVDGGWTQW